MSEHTESFKVPQRQYIKLISVNLLQLNSAGVLARVLIVDVAYSMRCQVDMPILVIWNLVFPAIECVSLTFSACCVASTIKIDLPLIESYVVLDKQQDLIW